MAAEKGIRIGTHGDTASSYGLWIGVWLALSREGARWKRKIFRQIGRQMV